MGIPGLTTYINNHSHCCMENYQLHDTYLVIDGNSLASQLYPRSLALCSFGGDYDLFAESVRTFFKDLKRCNITPLVLIDGGTEDKKINTVIKRTGDRIQLISCYTLQDEHNRTHVFPTLIKESFKEVLKELNIKFAQSTFEADSDIAVIAKVLNCPVLSFDSDFYIYDVPYIPINTLNNNVTTRSDGKGYVKNCQIYRVQKLLANYPGLDKSVLPLLAALLGNDYIKNNLFTKFFQSLKLPRTDYKVYNEQQRRIKALLHWLKNHTLDSAIQSVLQRLRPQDEGTVLQSIELVVNAYKILSPKILLSFGFSEDYVKEISSNIVESTYRYNDSTNLKISRCKNLAGNVTEDNIYEVLPNWFLKDYNAGNFCAFYIDFLVRQQNITSVQIENILYPSTVLISLPILSVMYKLVTTGIVEPYKPLTYVVRNSMRGYERRTLTCSETILGEKFPSLHDLRQLPKEKLKRIMDETIGLTAVMKIEELPDSWQLYIGTIIFYMKQDIEPRRNALHLYSLLFAMLFNIIDLKIGFYRKMLAFQKTYAVQIEEINKNKLNEQKVELPEDVSLQQAINEVTINDCLMIAPFFISNFSMDEELKKNQKKFNLTLVHTFNMFQSCLKHVLHLNALLGYPYKQPQFTQLLNGTFLYNMYIKLKGRNSIDAYIKHVLQNSPTLLRVVEILIRKVQRMCELVDVKILKENSRKQEKKKRKWKSAEEFIDIGDTNKDDEANSSAYLGNNKFAILAPQ